MTVDAMWFDFYWPEKLFGFGVFTIKRENLHRSLFSIYWNDGDLLIDLGWFRILTH